MPNDGDRFDKLLDWCDSDAVTLHLYIGRDGNQIIIMLCGGDKRTQGKDIAKAKEYWTDYKARKTEDQL